MKKLNKTEIEALARRVRSEIKVLAEAEQMKLDAENEAFYASMVEGITSELDNLTAPTKKFILDHASHRGDGFTEQQVRNHLREKQTKYVVQNTYDNATIVDSLILAQLEVDSVDELINSVVKQFTKEV